jgi:hypothetical protein
MTLVRNPLIWACAIGLAINVAHLPLPRIWHEVADALGRSSLGSGVFSKRSANSGFFERGRGDTTIDTMTFALCHECRGSAGCRCIESGGLEDRARPSNVAVRSPLMVGDSNPLAYFFLYHLVKNYPFLSAKGLLHNG